MIDTNLLLVILFHLVPILYAVTFFDYLMVFVTDDPLIRRLARPLLVASVGVHALYLLGFTIFFEHVPMVNVFQLLGVIAFAVAVTYLWVESRTGTPHTGPFLLFLVLLFIVASSFFPKLDAEVPEILRSKLFSFHVSAAVLGYSGFAVAAVYGLLYLMLYYKIRAKSFGLFFRRLPPLDVLDRMNIYAATTGFLFLTVAIVVGAVWSSRVFGEVHLDPKVMAALLTWAIYGGALASRRFVHWSGQRLAYSSVFGFAVILFSMFAVNFLLTSFHVFTS